MAQWLCDIEMLTGAVGKASANGLAFVTPVAEHWLEQEIAQWVHNEESIRRPIAPWADALPRILKEMLCSSGFQRL